MYGKTDDGLIAEPIDLATGKPGGSTMLACEHVGLALLEIGGLDPTQFLPVDERLNALVRSV